MDTQHPVTHLQEKLADVFSLVTLKLNNLSVFGMFDHSTITGKFLEEYANVQQNWVKYNEIFFSPKDYNELLLSLDYVYETRLSPAIPNTPKEMWNEPAGHVLMAMMLLGPSRTKLFHVLLEGLENLVLRRETRHQQLIVKSERRNTAFPDPIEFPRTGKVWAIIRCGEVRLSNPLFKLPLLTPLPFWKLSQVSFCHNHLRCPEQWSASSCRCVAGFLYECNPQSLPGVSRHP